MMDEIRVLLVDDHTLVRTALADLLSNEPDITVTNNVPTADVAVKKAAEDKPGVVLMDIDMPGRDCFDAAERIAAICPECCTVFLSAHVQDHYIGRALKVKARGYITKSETPEKVVAAIREVAAGGSYFSKNVRDRIVIDERGVRLKDKLHPRIAELTPREVEVLRYIAGGNGKKEISQFMHISVKTVDHHTTRLMNKLDIHDRVGLARFAIREGLIEP
jgi:DNA-binding NarL/FixJ family response regulator